MMSKRTILMGCLVLIAAVYQQAYAKQIQGHANAFSQGYYPIEVILAAFKSPQNLGAYKFSAATIASAFTKQELNEWQKSLDQAEIAIEDLLAAQELKQYELFNTAKITKVAPVKPDDYFTSGDLLLTVEDETGHTQQLRFLGDSGYFLIKFDEELENKMQRKGTVEAIQDFIKKSQQAASGTAA